jgi:hypothetical protein
VGGFPEHPLLRRSADANLFGWSVPGAELSTRKDREAALSPGGQSPRRGQVVGDVKRDHGAVQKNVFRDGPIRTVPCCLVQWAREDPCGQHRLRSVQDGTVNADVMPPSRGKAAPVTNPASSLAR